MKYRNIFFSILISNSYIACNDIYKAGSGIQLLSVEIKTNINQDVAFKYLDSSDILSKYQLPTKFYSNLKNGGDLEYFPESNKVVYFKSYPEEAYHLNSNGVFNLQQVFNPKIDYTNWINNTSKFKDIDYDRFEKRIDTFLKDIIKVERKFKISDSVIFWRKPYDSIICKLIRPYPTGAEMPHLAQVCKKQPTGGNLVQK